MTSFMYDRMGAPHREVDDDAIERVLAELDEPRNDEHPDVSIQHESGWALAAFQSGLLVWENVEVDSGPRHIRAVPRDRVRVLFRHVAAGEIDVVEAEPWVHGYG